MLKKYELILISKNIQHLCDTADIVLFLNELIARIDANHLLITYEMTLLVYNIVLNSNHDYTVIFDRYLHSRVKRHTLHILQTIFNGKLVPQHIEKINNDLNFIETHKEYMYISDAVWLAYVFFF